MRPVYSTQFLVAADVSGFIEYTVPDGFTGVLRDVDVFMRPNAAGGAVTILGNAGNVIAYFTAGIDTAVIGAWRGRQVIPEGQTITANVLTGLADYALSGYLLTLP